MEQDRSALATDAETPYRRCSREEILVFLQADQPDPEIIRKLERRLTA